MNIELKLNLAQQHRLELLAQADTHRRVKPEAQTRQKALKGLLARLRTGAFDLSRNLRLQRDLG